MWSPEPPREYDEDQRLISYNSVRGLIGWVGIAMPIVLVGLGALIASVHGDTYGWDEAGIVQTSLSDYHGTYMRNVFVGMLTALGVFLLAYKGHDTRDDWMASLSGAMAILVAAFPDDCDPPASNVCNKDSFLGLLSDATFVESHWIHFGAAVTLFAVMGVMCLAQFTRTDQSDRIWPRQTEVTKGKWRRNIAFIVSGFVIHACLLAVAGSMLLAEDPGYSLLIAETIMVFAFGFAWQLKGEVGRHVTNPAVAWLLRPYQRFFWKGD